MGNTNPNCKYQFDRCFFSDIDTEEKAYLLGWIASDGSICANSWTINILIDKNDAECLETLRDIICEEIPIKSKKDTNLIGFSINSRQVCEDVCKTLGINRGKKSSTVLFPRLANNGLTWAFIRGYFEGDGTIRKYNTRNTPECSISSNSYDMLTSMADFCGIPYTINRNTLLYCGTNSIDFLGKAYENCKHLHLQRKFDTFLHWLSWKPCTCGVKSRTVLPECYMFKTDINAVLPSKSRMSDVGYDLTIIKKEKEYLNNITLYDTGIKIKVKHGLYAEVVPRSSLSKSGYMLANSVGIIDPTYIGRILIALIKVDSSAPKIKLPFCCCQLVFRHQVHVDITEVAEDFNSTSRGEGSFGSTNIITINK
jgi:dUTP pyrophosphatase